MLASKRVKAFFRKHFTPGAPTSPPVSSSESPAVSPPLTRASSRPATPRSHHPPSGVTVADRPITQPRPHRRRRRRRSTSPVGLPLYSAEPGDEEMSIFKSTDMSSSRLDLSLSRATTGERSYVDQSDAEVDDNDGGAIVDEEDEHSFFARPSVDVSTDSHRRAPLFLTPPALVGRPRSASEPLGARRGRSGSSVSAAAAVRPGLSPYLSHPPGGSSPFASRSGMIDISVRAPSPTASPALAPGTATRPAYYSHRSFHSSPINSLTPPSTPGIAPVGRPRASTLQRLLGSSANSSSASLVGGGAGQGRSPYGTLGAKASSSSRSVREQGISMPLPNSFVHSSFVFPKTGPTPQQVAFLSSRESLGAYGYGPGVAPPPPSAPDPPAFAAFEPGLPLALARPHIQAQAQQGRGRSGSATSAGGASAPAGAGAGAGAGSPLARVVTLPHEGSAATPAPAELPRAVSSPEEESGQEADDRPSLPALDLDFAPLSLALPSGSPYPASEPPDPPTLARAGRPPEIVTHLPTPTGSATPSPRLGAPLGAAGVAPGALRRGLDAEGGGESGG